MIGTVAIKLGSLVRSHTRKHKEHMIFYKTFFTHLLGPGKKVQWLRLTNGLIRNHVSITTKEHML